MANRLDNAGQSNLVESAVPIAIGLMGVLAFGASLPVISTYATVVYTVPFAVMFLISFKSVLARRAFGAAVGATVPIAGFHYLFLYDLWIRLPSEGGGANIGLGLLLVYLMPFLVLFSSLAGWILTHFLEMRSAKSTSTDI